MRRHAKASSAGPNQRQASGAAYTGKSRGAAFGLALTAVVLLAFAPAASADYSVDRFIGGPAGSAAGFLSAPNGPAVSTSGEIYVSDSVNFRISKFDAAGNFLRTWGAGVKTGAFELEVCTAADVSCRTGVRGTAVGMLDRPHGIAVSPLNDHVMVVESNNARIQEFDSNGNFIRMWGWGVDDGSLISQVCTSDCQAGIDGSGPGQLGGGEAAANSIAISPIDGDVFVADARNRRVLRFNSDGTLDAIPVIGSAANFASNWPSVVTVDSQGILYAADGNNNGEVDRYDAYGVHSAGTPGFLASIAATSNGGPLLVGTESDSTSGLAVHLGASPSDDRLYVLRGPSSGNSVVQQLDDPGQAVPPATDSGPWLGSFFGGGSLFGSGRGLAYNSAANRLYTTSVVGAAGHGVFVFDEDGTGSAIGATIAPATSVAPTSAALNGTVDPADGLVRYHFEYSLDGNTWTTLPEVSLSGSGVQPVSQVATDLIPHSLYRVRLVETKVLSRDEILTSTSPETLLLTASASPTVVTRSPSSYDDTSAWLVADINPNNQSTSYRFEWGTTTSYGNDLPVPNASAGSGGVSKTFLQELNGLEPGTTYHYRVVASNDIGTANGTDQTFTTRPAFQGFPDRAYEQVSPVDKLNDINVRTNGHLPPVAASADGESKAFRTVGSLGGTDWGQDIGLNYGLAHRTADGWTVDPILPQQKFAANGQPVPLGFGRSDLSRQLFSASTPLMAGPIGLYLQDSNLDQLDLMTSWDPAVEFNVTPDGASDDLGHTAFAARTVLSSDAGIPGTGVRKVYEWTEGEVRLVSIQPGGIPLMTSSVIGGGSVGGSGNSIENAVSDDGNHIFFSSPESGDSRLIYRRSNATDTLLVSPSKRTPIDPAGPRDKFYLDATARQGPVDPASVLFASEEKLTNDATSNNPGAEALGDLYRYEINSDVLTNISAETNDPNGAEVLGLLGSSADANWVYYAANGRVVPGQGGVQGKPNVYLWHDDGTPSGVTRFIGTLAGTACLGSPLTPGTVLTEALLRTGDGCNFIRSGGGLGTFKSARVTPDGKTLLLQSTAPLTGYPSQGHNELYIYEAEANGGEGQLSCVSCIPSGVAAHHDALVPTTETDGALAQDLTRTLSSDGRRVFFNTVEPLAAEDTNGKLDVYEWEAGRLRLVSSGKSNAHSLLDGASADGRDVFFNTREQLVGQDTDGGVYDLYDARVGGGIAAQNPPPPGVPCVGSECKPPATPSPGSGSLPGSGSGSAGDYVVPFEVANLNVKQRRAFGANGKVQVRVLVREAGRIQVRALKGKKVLGTAATVALEPSTVQVPLTLRPFAMRMLEEQGGLRITLEVRFGKEVQRMGLRLRGGK